MSFSSLFSRFLGQSSAPQISPPPPSAPPTTPVPAPLPEALVRRQQAEQWLTREEILDGKNRLCGYLFRSQARTTAGGEEVSGDLIQTLVDGGIPGFAQRRLALVPVSPALLADERLALLDGPHTLYLLDLRQSGRLPEALLQSLTQAKEAGRRVALAGLSLDPELAPLLDAAFGALLSLENYTLSQFERLARGLGQRHPHLTLIASGVPSWPERRLCGALGFTYCLGPFATAPDEEEKGERLNESRLVLIEMLNQLRQEADLSALGEAAKKDPGVALHLLRLANSPAAGLVTPVASLEQAILVLGRERLYRWLTVAMFRTGQTRDRDEALLEIALTRARFMETLDEGRRPRQECEELFLVGLLSLFDVLLNQPMDKVLARLHLAEEVRSVLLRSEGPYAPYLALTLALERGLGPQARSWAEKLGLEGDLNALNQAALSWAESALQLG
ncbi:EAL and HDOD domain-containing protein [Azospira inquinata]|uniref:HDOD domain-containing protein n=1 Tax=Azospira inquinata TaxID=2785627 RepID=A0A975SLW7_9RHOO|nr:HDOD domain-containing protein [Azospira inquinata]QWT45990.1 HDOD domain-containing protein [Azospira inquinata]QWT48683.1 HDOD domain-containing protein [Azospira inquinata]